MFKRNEGTFDRIVHMALGTVLMFAGLFWFGGLQGNVELGMMTASFGVLALITGISGVCILYIPFGISTLETGK